MDVIVDGQRRDSGNALPESAMEALGAISEELRSAGRAIMAVRLNGKDIDADSLGEVFGDKSLDAIQMLEIRSESIQELVEASLVELESVLPELPSACHALAAVFQGDNPAEGYGPFQELADIWRHIKNRQELVARTLDVSLDTLPVGDTTFLAMLLQLNGYLQEAIEAIEANDCVLLGDLLEYELAPRAEKELLVIAELRKQLEARSV